MVVVLVPVRRARGRPSTNWTLILVVWRRIRNLSDQSRLYNHEVREPTLGRGCGCYYGCGGASKTWCVSLRLNREESHSHYPRLLDVTSAVLNQLDLYAQWSAAAYCGDNTNGTNTAVACSAGNCPTVQGFSTKLLYEFDKSVNPACIKSESSR